MADLPADPTAEPAAGHSTASAAGVRAAFEAALQRQWFTPTTGLRRVPDLLLRPLSWIVAHVAEDRRQLIARGRERPRVPGTPPVVVVGNLTVGGTGKTPLLIAMAEALRARGWRVGVIARGHGAQHAGAAAALVGPQSTAESVGDEALLIAQRTDLPVAVGHQRDAALRLLTSAHPCDVVLSDDGLQHVGLRRDLELAVFDARGAGNGQCLPAGPLREPLAGALLMDALVLNGALTAAPVPHSRIFHIDMAVAGLRSLDGQQHWSAAAFADETRGEPLAAIAGIGAPQRFFDTLAACGIQARPQALADHAQIDPRWLAALPEQRILMTEKDAVKCSGFDVALRRRCVALRIEAVIPTALIDWLEDRLRG
jgi:tetraacyldisaccharide 4'-kinase